MNAAAEQLVREAMDATGAEVPALLEEDAPVLSDEALAVGEEHDRRIEATGFYIVGIIGGKDVGKSALVNALAGRDITEITSHGPGTEIAVAYVHASREAAVRELLERETPGRYRIVTHGHAELERQVLMDLPDIDSHYAAHVAVTRTMLRHMLYPIWAQSVEKYADLQPQIMLAKVAAGNDARNFVFVLTKADQLETESDEGEAESDEATKRRSDEGEGGESEGASKRVSDHANRGESDRGIDNAVSIPSSLRRSVASSLSSPASSLSSSPFDAIREDYAARLSRTLSLPAPPRVFLCSARRTGQYDFAALRALVMRQKSAEMVREAKELAAKRQQLSLVDWLDKVNLGDRAERLGRLRREVEETLAARVVEPVFERVLPRIADDPANRAALADEILTERVGHWPLVSLVHTLLSPLFALVRTMTARHAVTHQGADGLVDFHLNGEAWSTAGAVQSAFAQLRQAQPAVAQLYKDAHLWETMDAEQAAGELSRRLAHAVERQRAAARERLAGRRGLIAPLGRWLVTVGALLWFPLIQPVLAAIVSRDIAPDAGDVAALVVGVLGVDYLLKSLGFLAVWFIVLWLALRWNTQRRVAKLTARWRSAVEPDPCINLAAQTLEWAQTLTDPVRRAHEKMADLAARAEKLRKAV